MNLKTLIFIILCFPILDSIAQKNTIGNILESVVIANRFNTVYPYEKVYLHMDNSSYFLDETLWYKAYVVNADSNKFSKASEILHVELLTPEGAIIKTQKHRLKQGTCDGYITLDSALYSGYFEIRAYTKAMLNFDEQNYFSRVFPLFEKPKQEKLPTEGLRTLPRFRTTEYLDQPVKKKQKNTVPAEFSIHFYPEGGNLIANLKSNIAFQAKDRRGQIYNGMCYLYNHKGVLLDSFSSTHLGMGNFQLTPKNEELYYVTLKHDDAKEKYFLPDALPNGYVLAVDNLSDSTYLKVNVEGTQLGDTLGLAVVNGARARTFSIVYATEEDTAINVKFKKSNLPEGVNQVILFNGKGQELASRMLFIQNKDAREEFKVKVFNVSEQQKLKAYEKQELLLEIKDKDNKGIETQVSLSICDSGLFIPTYSTNNIYTNLLLSSEIRGFIPNPHYYFTSEDENRKKNLDLLMRVYGWSRCKWENMCGCTPLEVKYIWEKQLMAYGKEYSQTWNTFEKDSHSVPQIPGPPKIPMSLVKSCEKVPIIRFFAKATHIYAPESRIVTILDSTFATFLHVYNDSTLYENSKKSSIFNQDSIPYFSLRKTKYGHYLKEFDDFYGETKYVFTIDNHEYKSYVRNKILTSINVFINYSAATPKEKAYDLFETKINTDASLFIAPLINDVYTKQITLDEVNIYEQNRDCFHPSIKINHYNRGLYNQLYFVLYTPIMDNVNSKRFSSLSEYHRHYNEKRDYQFCGELWTAKENIYTPAEYLNHYRLPLGTFTFVANMTIDTSQTCNKTSHQIPLRNDVPYIKDYNLDTAKYIYVIDSTILHTNYAKREELYNMFSKHKNYTQYRVKDIFAFPLIASVDTLPKYVIEHYCRVIKRESPDHNRNSIDKAREWFNNTYNVNPGKSFYYANRVPWHAFRERIQRVETLQGFTKMEKEFYSPDYSNEALPNQQDYRRTLYWNPNVKTDKMGLARIVFYNNAICEKYKLTVQGITEDGGLINYDETIK